jgi:hypothetical protein
MLDNRAWRVGHWRRSAQALVELQQHQEAELRGGSSGYPTGQEQLIWCRCESGVQVARAEDALQAWIGGVLEARHGGRAVCQRIHFLWHHNG